MLSYDQTDGYLRAIERQFYALEQSLHEIDSIGKFSDKSFDKIRQVHINLSHLSQTFLEVRGWNTDRIFWKDMTRDDACRAYADCAGQKDGETIFTDQDILWADEYNYAQVMSDKELIRRLEENYG